MSSGTKTYKMPHRWRPRDYQLDFWQKFIVDKSVDRVILLWGRRHGKDACALNALAYRAAEEQGLYIYFAPTASHAREIVWNNVMQQHDPDTGEKWASKPVDQAFPEWLVKRKLDQEMTIHLINGSVIRVMGSENYNRIVGVNARGVVYSEWGMPEATPESWEYIQPMLQENGGWAIFASTPRGMNHYYKLIMNVRGLDNWYVSKITQAETGIPATELIENERREGKPESKIRQEYYCDFLADEEGVLFEAQNLEACRERKAPAIDDNAPLIMGVDVARMGNDKAKFRYRCGNSLDVIPSQTFEKLDNYQLATEVINSYSKYKPDAIIIDATGTGSGVYDIVQHSLRGQTMVYGVNFAASSPDKSCRNMRSYMYVEFEKWTRNTDSKLPDDNLLMEELRVITKEFDANGKLKLVDKEQFRKKLGFSPDDADACALTFAHKIPGRMFMKQRGVPTKARMWD